MHIAASKLSCKSAMVSTYFSCMNVCVQNGIFHLAMGLCVILAGKAAWVQNGELPTNTAY